MHPNSPAFKSRGREELPESAMERNKTPDKLFPILLPPKIFGFKLLDKQWIEVSIDFISDVQWNKGAFDKLVTNPKMKELAKALVAVHNSANQTAYIMEGKGNGLIMLLHGSPGTGKTLTAETIAEIAEKPLYRVTCEDIGTDAEAVESYLETVLYIGKIWDCVVLLDEADVFLEERTMADIERNALVSVFLRLLEYYTGIIILTSNRVGAFDEAIKSRIQLALHYPVLTEPDRRKIWRNFIRMLSKPANSVSQHYLTPSASSSAPNMASTAIDINIEDLEDHIEDLAKHPLNGRQIRNAVVTAKKLALYLKETLDFTHFERVIEVTIGFDRFLEQAHGHSDDLWARQEGLR